MFKNIGIASNTHACLAHGVASLYHAANRIVNVKPSVTRGLYLQGFLSVGTRHLAGRVRNPEGRLQPRSLCSYYKQKHLYFETTMKSTLIIPKNNTSNFYINGLFFLGKGNHNCEYFLMYQQRCDYFASWFYFCKCVCS